MESVTLPMNPFALFQRWYEEEKSQSQVDIPSACCLSTLGLDAYPNARYVSLKEVKEDLFIVPGPTDSRKGQEMLAHPRAALSFWWTYTRRQVRVQGDVSPLPSAISEQYFKQRVRDAQLVSAGFRQGHFLCDDIELQRRFSVCQEKWQGQSVPRPPSWGGWQIQPIRIEFMQFQKSRLHHRYAYIRSSAGWDQQMIQP